MDIVQRLRASATSATCLEEVAAQEIERLRRIEAAAVKMIARPVRARSDEDDLLESVLQEFEP